jgi:hypothetical protein
VVQLLIDAKADVNAQNNTGQTPLEKSVENLEVAKLLIENGADVAKGTLVDDSDDDSDDRDEFVFGGDNIWGGAPKDEFVFGGDNVWGGAPKEVFEEKKEEILGNASPVVQYDGEVRKKGAAKTPGSGGKQRGKRGGGKGKGNSKNNNNKSTDAVAFKFTQLSLE